MNFQQCLVLVIYLTYLRTTKAKELTYEYVTCGSSLKLLNTYHQVRLHSHEVKYGQGSGQQSVTGVDTSDDHNSYWQVLGRTGVQCVRGQPIKCGQTVRFMHVTTRKNLHSHHFISPLSHNLEVSAFGEDGQGDEGDEWVIQCTGKYWRRKENIRMKHINTEAYLHVNGDRFGRPIAGQAEVCTISNFGQQGSEWMAAEGIFVKPNTEPLYNQSGDEEVPTTRTHDGSDL